MSTVEPDRDGDAPMLSSSSASSEAMFPSANDPPTPQNIHANNALPKTENAGTYATPYAEHPAHPGSELSPPDSQDHNAPVRMGDLMETEHTSVGEAGGMETRPEVARGREVEEQNEPGWGWKNKKAQDEWGRAMEMVVDRGFSLREFGDLFDEREANGETL
ncbi:hypothetical protein MMC30_005640 [Trapelia coarctata]|nr:hypothetical protein [Trapelia coarctata]